MNCTRKSKRIGLKSGRKRPKYEAPHSEHPENNQNFPDTTIHADHTEAFNASNRKPVAGTPKHGNLYAYSQSGMSIMSYYRYHVFFCTNQRDDGSRCCAQCNVPGLRDHLKQRTKELGLTNPGGVRINAAGCLDRCAEGPVIVVYPEATWYTYVDREDIEEILTEHLVGGRVVERLRLPDRN